MKHELELNLGYTANQEQSRGTTFCAFDVRVLLLH